VKKEKEKCGKRGEKHRFYYGRAEEERKNVTSRILVVGKYKFTCLAELLVLLAHIRASYNANLDLAAKFLEFFNHISLDLLLTSQ
jgi:hypothetical protein